jgi:hypothetical protein
VLIVAALTLVPSCARRAPVPVEMEVGRHRVRLSVPPGWEHLDHCREQLFRNGEMELRLADLGPATPAGLADEVRTARTLWLKGRRLDALARIRSLDGPILRILPSPVRAEFWRPWTADPNASPADSASLGGAIAAMIDRAEALPPVSADQLVEYVLERSSDAARREIERRDSLGVHGSSWIRLGTWSRLSHMGRRSDAFTVRDGGLLALTCERGSFERTGGAFDSLLATIEVLPRR